MRRRVRLDWFDSFSDGRRRITLLPCNHWTMRNPFRGPNRSLWGAYLIETSGGVTIFVSGDTAYFDGFEELGRIVRHRPGNFQPGGLRAPLVHGPQPHQPGRNRAGLSANWGPGD